MTTQDFTAIVIGEASDPRRGALEAELQRRTRALSHSHEQLVLDQGQLASSCAPGSSVAVVLCRAGMSGAEIAAIDECKRRSIPIIPVVARLADFGAVAPAEVSSFNGFELADIKDIAELAGLVLEFLGLQRSKRKIFISYARRDASRVAQQLRDAFTARWYSVFLDTISIRPGAVFQDELLQELADSDVVVLLNSPSVKDRPYVQQEIAFADQAGVGGVQVVWPGVAALREGGFFMPIFLGNPEAQSPAVFESALAEVSLTQAGLAEVVRSVADLRTQLQELREEQIVAPILDHARDKGWSAVRYLGRHVELQKHPERIHLNVALGVPSSLDLARALRDAHPRPPAGRLVYDPLGVTREQAAHLDFLGSELKLQFLDPKKTEQWTILP
jgi:hypothetical protein